jgi:signal transduction histidine kinase
MIKRQRKYGIYKFIKEFFRRHKERHHLHDERHSRIRKESQEQRAEIHRLQNEYHKKIHELHKESKEFHWYHRHNKYSRIYIVLFNLLIWFLIFRYFGAKTISIVFAAIISISGIIQFIFHSNLEKRIFRPINQLKIGVDEISKGNYDINIECNVTNEISVLVDSFNDMAKKLNEGEKLKRIYEENRKTLIANISHDLKTPITSIQGYIETMLDITDVPKDTINKYHQIIYNNAAYINKLIDDLFLFSKLDIQKLDLQIEEINTRAFMEDLMEEFKYELEDRGIKFNYEDSLHQDYYINIDRKRVNQVFRNIIGNAVKYGFEEKLVIHVKLYTQGEFACIDIENNGPGIPEDKLPYIFDRFYRVDYARTKDLMSTGLGLAIAKELVEAHEGEISAASKEKEGTCFTIKFPMRKTI